MTWVKRDFFIVEFLRVFFFFFDYPNTLCDSSMDLLHDIPQEPSFHEVPMGQVVCEKPDLRNEMLNQT